MPRSHSVHVCQSCGTEAPKWQGRCGACGEWNRIVEQPSAPPRRSGSGAARSARAASTTAIDLGRVERVETGIAEFDRVLGGGFVPGAVLLVGGEPGIGKSTLLTQALARTGGLYVSAEESPDQVALRAERLGLEGGIEVLAETSVERIVAEAERLSPPMLVLDSIQTVALEALESPAGSLAQLREVAARLSELARRQRTIVVLVGHVTKDGTLAGPRTLEHLVDVVLYFEGERGGAARVVRCVKNRFGPATEVGLFEMTGTGLRGLDDPSALLLAERLEGASGCVVVPALEGTRPLLVEVQALVSEAGNPSPRRSAVGMDPGRLPMLLAVVERKAALRVSDRDVFLNLAGGARIQEPAIDLGVIVAVASSLRNRAVAADRVVLGEVGLAGEVRSVPAVGRRLAEAARRGFRCAIVPRGSLGDERPAGIETLGVGTVAEAIEAVVY